MIGLFFEILDIAIFLLLVARIWYIVVKYDLLELLKGTPNNQFIKT